MLSTGWGKRFAELAATYDVPGATVAYWHDGRIHEHATGVLNTTTGVPATPDSLFQIGSITKVWTATQVMRLIERGELALDDRVVEALPEFPGAPEITVRHLLTHTSGLDGDLFVETGRGDDCLERYVAACADLQQVFAPGSSYSYSNAGYCVLGRMVERVTGSTWDEALRDLVITPLELTHTCTLPEDVLRFSSAIGHDGEGKPVERWGLMRCIGPAGLICATAADVVAFGRAHLSPGTLLDDPALLREPQIDLPNPYDGAQRWGIGWGLDDWDGEAVALHTGDTIGQHAALAVLPGTGTVVALLTNGGLGYEFQQALLTELLAELDGIAVPEPLAPSSAPVDVLTAPHVGVYVRAGNRITITESRSGLHMLAEPTEGRVVKSRAREFDLLPVRENVFVGRSRTDEMWMPVVFEDGFVHYSGRATPLLRSF